MNKSGLIEVVSERLGDRRAASAAVEAVVDAITRTVAKGEKVGISGFGVFERVDRAARTARNPTTGEAVMLEETRVPKFRPGQGFKDIVSGAKEVSDEVGERAVTARAGVPRAAKGAGGTTPARTARAATSGRGAGRTAAKSSAGSAAKAPVRAAANAPARSAAAKAPSKAPAKAAPAVAAKAPSGRTVAAPGAARSAAAAKAPGRASAPKAPAAKAAKAPAKRASR